MIVNTINLLLKKLKNKTWQKILINSSWLMWDNVFRFGGNFVLLIWLAGYLGPQKYGIYNIALTFTAIWMPLSSFGIDSIVSREISLAPHHKAKILGSALVIKAGAGIIACLVSIASVYMITFQTILTTQIIILLSLLYFVQLFDIVDYYFQSQTQSKYSVIAKSGAFGISLIIKVICIWMHASIVVIASISLLEAVLSGVFLILAYQIATRETIFSWQFDPVCFKQLIIQGIPLMFANIFILINMHIDKLMIGNMMGDSQAGIYFAATRISEVMYFVPMVIGPSVIPTLIEKKKINKIDYINSLQIVLTLLCLFALIISVVITVIAPLIIVVLYPSTYLQSIPILQIHIWTIIFVFFISIQNRIFVIENLQKLIFLISLITVIIKIFFNVIFITKYGAVGAAYSAIFSWIPAVLIPGLFVKTRFSIIMFYKSFLFHRLLPKKK